MTTTALTGIDFRKTGIQLGYAPLTHSDNVYDNSIIPVPMAVISSGSGPTALLVAGTHGDEYEGQVLLHDLIRNVLPEYLTGTLIIVPSANTPAVRSGTRVSPIDGGNLNRSYPGGSSSDPTSQIARVIANELVPRADVVLDLHSGGSNANYLPCTFLYRGPSEELWQQKAEAAEALGLPYVMIVPPRLEPGSLSTAGDDAGLLTLSTELGGGGTVDKNILESARNGLTRLLTTVGILKSPDAEAPTYVGNDGARSPAGYAADSAPQWVELLPDSAVVSTASGLLEPHVELGQHVTAGQLVARVHFIEELEREPKSYFADRDGIVAIMRRPTLVVNGSHLLHIATVIHDPTEIHHHPYPAPAN